MLWDKTQLSFWRFARTEIPQDIHNGTPNPDSWGSPIARWTDESCDIENAFRDMQRTSRPFSPSPPNKKYGIENPVPSFFQWLSTSLFVVTGPDLLMTTAASQELARTPSRTHLTTTVRDFYPLMNTTYLNFLHRRFDQDQQHLRLPEILIPSVFISVAF